MFIDKCSKLINVLFLLVAIWINIIVLGVSIKQYTLLFIVVVFGLFVCYLILKRKENPIFSNSFFKNNQDYIFVSLLIIAFFVMLIIAFCLEVDIYNTWDYGQIIRSAYEALTNGQLENTEYFARYPNNSFYVLILYLYFKCISPLAQTDIYNYLNATIPVNCILVALSILFAYLAAKEFLPGKAAFRAGIIMLGMSPLYVYATIAYTDVFAIFPVSLILFFYMKSKSEQTVAGKILWLGLAALVSAMGYKIKATLIIIFLAIVIDIFFMILKRKEHFLMLLVYIGVFFATTSVCSNVSLNFLYENGVTEEMQQEEEFPITHWLMMSVNPQYSGGFNQEDVDFTRSFEGKEAKTSANIAEYKERLKNMGVGGTIEHMLVKKVVRMWGTGDCNASDYVGRQPRSENICREIFSLSGRYNYIYRMYAQIYYVFILLSILRTAFLTVKAKGINKGFVIELAFLGVFMFFLIWECNSRYLFVFFPILVLLASGMECRQAYYRRKKICDH